MSLFSRSRQVNTDPRKIEYLLSHGVEEVFVRESLEKKLRSGKQLRVKLGVDPTSPHLHIGRAIVLWKLREFQEMGHKVVFIVGDFTALVGDPSDKLEKRPMLSPEKIKENIKSYREQVGKIIDLSTAEFHFNSKWLGKLTFSEIINLAECFSVQQMSHRRNFADRIEKGEEISLREFMYPLMQGYDSVMVEADVELGGFDQLFNLKAGRVTQKHYGQKEQDIMAGVMLEGTDGRKMSSSWGNVINITDEPNDMYGKAMSVSDDLVGKYLRLCTRLGEEEINRILSLSENPRDSKMKLAYELVKLYHGEDAAKKAEKRFVAVFQGKGVPDDTRTILISGEDSFADALVNEKIVSSKSEWRRLVAGGGVDILGGETIKDQNYRPKDGEVVRVGKKRFVKIKIN